MWIFLYKISDHIKIPLCFGFTRTQFVLPALIGTFTAFSTCGTVDVEVVGIEILAKILSESPLSLSKDSLDFFDPLDVLDCDGAAFVGTSIVARISSNESFSMLVSNCFLLLILLGWLFGLERLLTLNYLIARKIFDFHGFWIHIQFFPWFIQFQCKTFDSTKSFVYRNNKILSYTAVYKRELSSKCHRCEIHHSASTHHFFCYVSNWLIV